MKPAPVHFASLLALALPLPAMGGGFECRMERECSNLGCFDVSYTPYIDTEAGGDGAGGDSPGILLRGIGIEIALEGGPQDSSPERWRLFAALPQNGLLTIEIDTEDDRAVFATFGRRGDSPWVTTVSGRCVSMG